MIDLLFLRLSVRRITVATGSIHGADGFSAPPIQVMLARWFETPA
jgi:hypothetical protein